MLRHLKHLEKRDPAFTWAGGLMGWGVWVAIAFLLCLLSFGNEKTILAQDDPVLSGGPLLRKLSLDLRGRIPARAEVDAVLSAGKNPLEFVDEFIESPDFLEQVRLYHRDKVWPNFDNPERLHYFDYLQEMEVDGQTVYFHPYTDGAQGCKPQQIISVFPYWDPSTKVNVCEKTVGAFTTLSSVGTKKPTPDKKKSYKFDCTRRWDVRYCGCGETLEHCTVYKRTLTQLKDMGDEGPRMAVEIIRLNRPYTDIVTAQWSMRSGPLSHLYLEKLSTTPVYVGDLFDKKWRAVGRKPVHSGYLTSAGYLRRFGTGKDWSVKTLEDFTHCKPLTDGSTNPLFASAPDALISNVAQFHQGWLWKSTDRNSVQLPPFFGFLPNADNRDTSEFEGQSGQGVPAFASILAGSESFRRCTVVSLFQYFVGRDPDEVKENAEILKLADWFRDVNFDFKKLVKSVVLSRAYRRTP
jgi:hypothetical protein